MTLSRTFQSAFLGILGTAFLAGCVTTSKYKKLEADKDQQITAKDQQIVALQNQLTTSEKSKADLAAEKEALAKSNAQTETQYNALVNQLADEVQKGDLKVTQYKNMLTVDVAEKIFFASGSAMLKDTGKDVLKKLAKALQGYPDKYVRVVGHTDNVPISKAAFASNWELSASRSTTVIRELQAAGVPPQHLIVSARGEYAPIAPNDTPEGRQKNRRIEIMLLDKNLVESVQPK